MGVALAIFGIAAAAWGAIVVRRASLWSLCGAFVGLAYVLAPPFWSVRLGPAPLNVERLLLLGLLAVFVWRAAYGRLEWRQLQPTDFAVAALVGYLTLRCAATPPPPVVREEAGAWWRLITAFWIPTFLYVVARTTPLRERDWRGFLAMIAFLGGYLAFTAFAEVGQQWWAVVPRFIADPALGTHFGRARGPALNSASLGVCLTYCYCAAWVLWPGSGKIGKAALVALWPAIFAAMYFTYTRSTWIGIAASATLLPLLQMPRRLRYATALLLAFAGCVAVVALADKLTALGRKDSDSSAEHSVYQRASFAIVSARMVRDAPLWGCGFGRFYDLKTPYLAQRTQQVELESLRKLDHHNTLLSILVETGLVGFALYALVIAAWLQAAWRLTFCSAADDWQRRHGLFTVGVLAAYGASALFHDLTLSPSEHWVLFLAAGGVANLTAQARRSRPARAAANEGLPPRAFPTAGFGSSLA